MTRTLDPNRRARTCNAPPLPAGTASLPGPRMNFCFSSCFSKLGIYHKLGGNPRFISTYLDHIGADIVDFANPKQCEPKEEHSEDVEKLTSGSHRQDGADVVPESICVGLASGQLQVCTYRSRKLCLPGRNVGSVVHVHGLAVHPLPRRNFVVCKRISAPFSKWLKLRVVTKREVHHIHVLLVVWLVILVHHVVFLRRSSSLRL